MLLNEVIRQAVTDLKAHRLRSTLTLFGIIWGIMAIMILLGWGFGFRDLMWEGMSKIGEDLVVFLPGHTSIGVGGYKTGRPIIPEMKDIEAIRIQCPSVQEINPQVMRWYYVKVENESRQYNIRGVIPAAKEMNNWEVAKGRFISEYDIKNRRRFAFIGNNVRKQLFGEDSNPVGSKMKIRGVTFHVVGLAVEKELQASTINSRHDDQILIPLSTAQQLWGDGKSLDLIFVTPKENIKSGQVVSEIRSLLAERHNFDPEDSEALMIFEFAFFEKMFNILALGLNILLGLIGVVTLFVGGVGVMNIMLVSVQERIHEIGIRKAVGARKRDIRLHFLAEALFITMLGGLIGFLLGSALLGAINLLPLPPSIPLPQNSIELSLIVVFVMILTGILSGYIPARNAAEMEPAKALQYERGETVSGKKEPKPLWTSRTLTGELIGQAVLEIRTSKSRSFLTMFGIFWGIAAIIILTGFGTGFQNFFEREFGKMGEKTIYISGGRVKSERGSFRQARRVRLTEKDVRALNSFPYEIERALPEYDCGNLVVKYRNESRAVHTLGVVPDTLTMRNYIVSRGRFINQGDIERRERVCFLGATIQERLFGSRTKDISGEYVSVSGIRYRVIGTAETKGYQLSINNSLDDEKILIPFTTALKDFSGNKYLSRVLVSPVDKNRFDETEREIRKSLSRLHRFDAGDEDALYIWSQLEGMDFINYIVLGLQIFLGGVGVITLMIGGVGVMNIMFFVVTQRTREIGIRRAIGALKKHIFFQLFVEAFALIFIGGLIGLGIGLGLNAGLSVLVEALRTQSPQLMMLFSPENSLLTSVITAFFMVIAGFVAGLTPALRAMKLDIVECLRYE
ncbi:MAG TPA: FtsX-like permease family protein [Candidatus Aminicenantes bacterium]|nr:FtsX-like permease family protein [Candidatus Aminicenantes bacterium]